MPKESAKRTRIAKPIESVDCVVFVVDAADEFRMAVARDELWRLCGLVPPGDESGPGRFRTLERSAAPARLADSAAVLVLANKSDVAGALDAGEVGDALDLDQLRAEPYDSLAVFDSTTTTVTMDGRDYTVLVRVTPETPNDHTTVLKADVTWAIPGQGDTRNIDVTTMVGRIVR